MAYLAFLGVTLSLLLLPAPATAEGLSREQAHAIVNAADRTEADRERDARRKPVELLVFAGVGPGMKVADLGASSGYLIVDVTHTAARATATPWWPASSTGHRRRVRSAPTCRWWRTISRQRRCMSASDSKKSTATGIASVPDPPRVLNLIQRRIFEMFRLS